jgi:hypothetical protein
MATSKRLKNTASSSRAKNTATSTRVINDASTGDSSSDGIPYIISRELFFTLEAGNFFITEDSDSLTTEG